MKNFELKISGLVLLLCVVLLLQAFLTGCGTEVTQNQNATATIVIYYPNCATIEDDELMIECIEAASSAKITLDAEESELLEQLGIPRGEGNGHD